MDPQAKKAAKQLLENWKVDFRFENGKFFFTGTDYGMVSPTTKQEYYLKQIDAETLGTFVNGGCRNTFSMRETSNPEPGS